MMEKLNIKKEKIVDIQEAMKKGDLNNDGILDFDEWRHTMKMYDIHRTYLLPCLFIGVTPGVWGHYPHILGLGGRGVSIMMLLYPIMYLQEYTFQSGDLSEIE